MIDVEYVDTYIGAHRPQIGALLNAAEEVSLFHTPSTFVEGTHASESSVLIEGQPVEAYDSELTEGQLARQYAEQAHISSIAFAASVLTDLAVEYSSSDVYHHALIHDEGELQEEISEASWQKARDRLHGAWRQRAELFFEEVASQKAGSLVINSLRSASGDMVARAMWLSQRDEYIVSGLAVVEVAVEPDTVPKLWLRRYVSPVEATSVPKLMPQELRAVEKDVMLPDVTVLIECDSLLEALRS